MGDGLICAIFLHNANRSRGSGCLSFTPDNFINDTGLAKFLPVYTQIGNSVIPSSANPYAASGRIVYEKEAPHEG